MTHQFSVNGTLLILITKLILVIKICLSILKLVNHILKLIVQLDDPIWPIVGTISVKDLSEESSSCFQSIVNSCSYRVVDSNLFILNCENQEIELSGFKLTTPYFLLFLYIQ